MKDYLFTIVMVIIVCITALTITSIACEAAKEIAYAGCKNES